MFNERMQRAISAFISIELGRDIFPRFPQEYGSTSAIWQLIDLEGNEPTVDKRGHYDLVLSILVQCSTYSIE